MDHFAAPSRLICFEQETLPLSCARQFCSRPQRYHAIDVKCVFTFGTSPPRDTTRPSILLIHLTLVPRVRLPEIAMLRIPGREVLLRTDLSHINSCQHHLLIDAMLAVREYWHTHQVAWAAGPDGVVEGPGLGMEGEEVEFLGRGV